MNIENIEMSVLSNLREKIFVKQGTFTFDSLTKWSRKQGKHESVTYFFVAILEVAENCKLDHLGQELIRDQFIINMKNCHIRRAFERDSGTRYQNPQSKFIRKKPKQTNFIKFVKL